MKTENTEVSSEFLKRNNVFLLYTAGVSQICIMFKKSYVDSILDYVSGYTP